MGGKRSRWWLIGGLVAGAVAAIAGAALMVKKVFAPGDDDFEAEPHDDAVPLTATESGSSGTSAVDAETPASEPEAPPEQPSEPPATPSPAPRAEAGSRQAGMDRTEPASSTGATTRLDADQASAEPAAEAAPAQPAPGDAPSEQPEPPAPPSAPFTEEQAEMNQRLQERQDELLQAFPTMTRHDIVACDGDLARLAVSVAPAAGTDEQAVLAQLLTILHAGPEEATNPDTLASREPMPESPQYGGSKPERGD